MALVRPEWNVTSGAYKHDRIQTVLAGLKPNELCRLAPHPDAPTNRGRLASFSVSLINSLTANSAAPTSGQKRNLLFPSPPRSRLAPAHMMRGSGLSGVQKMSGNAK